MLLAHHFATRMSYELDRSEMPHFSKAAIGAMEAYSWKGNIRELKNVVERAVYRSDTSIIEGVVFDPFVSPYGPPPSLLAEPEIKETAVDAVAQKVGATSIKQAVEDLEKGMIQKALTVCRHNQRKAATYLGLSYDQLRGKIRKYGSSVLKADS